MTLGPKPPERQAPRATRRPEIWGYPVLEGVLVATSAGAHAVAVRRETGEVVVRRRWRRQGHLFDRALGLRGLVVAINVIYALGMGLTFSAAQLGLGPPLPRAQVGTGALPPQLPGQIRLRRLKIALLALCLATAGLLGLGMVLVAPPLLARLGARGAHLGPARLWWEMALGLLFVPTYLGALSRLPFLQQMVRYHGALHQGFAAYEAGLPLEPKAVLSCDLHQARCPVHLACLWALVLPCVARLGAALWPSWSMCLMLNDTAAVALFTGLCARLVAGVVALGFAYELWRVVEGSRARGGVIAQALCRRLSSPTVAEPDAAMLEVVLAAMRAALGSSAAGLRQDQRSNLRWAPFSEACTRAERPSWQRPRTQVESL